MFLYRKVLELDMPALEGLERARRPDHRPNVLSRRDVVALLDQLEPPFRLLGELLYGSGLRLEDAISLRVKDVDLERHQITLHRAHARTPRPVEWCSITCTTRRSRRRSATRPIPRRSTSVWAVTRSALSR